MNPLLKQIAEQSAADLIAQVEEAEKDIQLSIDKATEESQAQETPLKFSLSFKIAINFDESTVNNTLSWTVKQSLETSHQLEDPNQTNLPITELRVGKRTAFRSHRSAEQIAKDAEEKE